VSVDDSFEKWAEGDSAEAKEYNRLERKLLAVRAERSRLNTRLRAAETDLREVGERYAEILEITERPVEPLKVRVRERGEKGKSATTPVALFSDAHLNESVDPRTVRNLNEYNPEIAAERTERFFRKILTLVNLRRRADSIEDLVVAILGDTINAVLRPEDEATWSMPISEAKIFARDLLVGGFDFLLERGNFEKILVPCVVGNHGRMTKEMRFGTGAVMNHEWELYRLLELHYKSEKRIEFDVARGADVDFTIGKMTFRCLHGWEIGYRDAIGGIATSLNKRMFRTLRMDPADHWIYGHYHFYAPAGPYATGNGSVIGYNAYAAAHKLEFQAPTQCLLFIDQRRREVKAIEPVWVG
jgi:hypothetical protein